MGPGCSVAGLDLWVVTDAVLTADMAAVSIGVDVDLNAAAGNARLLCRWIANGSLDGPSLTGEGPFCSGLGNIESLWQGQESYVVYRNF